MATEENIKIENIKMAIFERLQDETSFEALAPKFDPPKSTLGRYYNLWAENVPRMSHRASQSLREIFISDYKK